MLAVLLVLFARAVPVWAAPPQITSATAFTVDEGTTTVVTTLTATDDDTAAADLLWSKTGGADSGKFSLTNAGVLTFDAVKDYEDPDDADSDGSYEVTVQVSDGTNTDTADLVVTIRNVVELTAITGPPTVSFAENGAARVATFTASSEEDRDGIEWMLSGDDARHFSIDSPPGALRFDIDPVAPNLFPQPPDFEDPVDSDTDNDYQITLLARVGTTVTDTPLSVTVTVTDVDEAGKLALSSTRPTMGTDVTATLADPDRDVAGTVTWKWEQSSGRSIPLWTEITGATSDSYTPALADAGEFLRATATYTDDFGVDKSAYAVTSEVVTAHVLSGLAATTAAAQSDSSTWGLKPAFSAGTLHYAIGCGTSDAVTNPDDIDTMMLTLEASSDSRLAVDGVQVATGEAASVPVTGESDVSITVSRSDGGSTTYVVHCLATSTFPRIVTEKSASSGVIEDLIMFVDNTYLLILDNNGVPRYRWYSKSGSGPFFRFHRTGKDAEYRYSHGRLNKEIVFRDQNLKELAVVSHKAPLNNTDTHDHSLLDDGSFLIMSYPRASRDLSDLTFNDSSDEPYGVHRVRDSAIQIQNPSQQVTFTWNSWGNMALEDCTNHRFPDDYAHLNGLQMVNGRILGTFRGCSKVLLIDPALSESHKVVWRLGRTYLSDEEWARREADLGPAPFQIIGDPEEEFCGMHAGQLLPNGNLLIFDNGSHCVRNPWTEAENRRDAPWFSRAAEYAIDEAHGEAVFMRDHSLHGTRNHGTRASGFVEDMDNGDWLISWGRSARQVQIDNGLFAMRPDEATTQVDPDTGEEKFSIEMTHPNDLLGDQMSVRAIPLPPSALTREALPLTAEIVKGVASSLYHTGAADAPQVVVAFSRPVVDFAAATSSVQVSGATVRTVGPHRVAGTPANAYVFTLTPMDDAPITFRLLANQACGLTAEDGICTADGTLLSEVPTATHTIPGPVTVRFGAPDYSATEGGTTSVIVDLNPANGRLDPVEIPLVVTGGSATAPADYTVPSSVTFGPTETRTSVSVATGADASIEGTETIEVAFGAPPAGVTLGTTTTTTVTIADRTPSARFALTLNPTTVVESSDAAVSVAITNGVTFATAQTLTLSFSGTATQGTDYTVDSTTLTLLAGQSSATTTLRVVDDADAESDETIMVEVAHEGTRVAARTATIPASDQPGVAPQIAIRAGRNPVGEAEGASFTVTRTGATTARLTVAVRVSESGSILAGTPPTTVTFAVGQENVPLLVPTVDDTIVEGASETSVVTAAVEADPHDSPLYLLGSPFTAQVTVEDDDEAAFAVTVTPNPVTEDTTATVTVAITTGVTFPADQVLTLVFSGGAEQGTDYTVGADTLTLPAGQTSVPTDITILDDGAKEPAETLEITAQHGGQVVGQAMLTIAASEDTKPPTLEQAEVLRDGRTLRLTFSEPLDEANAPPRAAFVVTVDDNGTDTSMAVTTVAVSGARVTLSLASSVVPAQGVTVSYTIPSSAWPALQDPAGQEVASFAEAEVENQSQVGRGGGNRDGGGGGSEPAAVPEPPVGYLENPDQDSFQSGVGVLSGWTCDAEEVEIVLNGEPQEAAYGTARLDTAGVCGDTDNGFGLLFNWNLLGDGEHEVVALVDRVELDRATVMVTTLGAEFLRDVTGTCTAADFPTGDETVTLAWQQTQQNFVIVDGAAPAGTTNRAGTPGVGHLENPGPNSYQSGIGVLSGWVCEGAEVIIELNGAPQPAAYGTERLDTEEACGDTDNGFGLLFNWNLLGEGAHEVVAYVDGEELGRATVRVTTLGQEFLRDVEGECTVADFPMLGETVALEWQQNSQNFVIIETE